MSVRPAFFELIRQRASEDWNLLEQRPDLAGAWYQLFMQVQNPRHVLSELLQNADDVGATEASVRIEDQTFIFSHNGEDFTKEHFDSLCRFAYSNKRTLHTIGFRGIGFKSTFSLGDTIELYTPTLSVSFNRERFTQPSWIDSGHSNNGETYVRVTMIDEYCHRKVEENLQEWLKNPVSLIFFKNIRRLRINDQEVHWGNLGPGPVPESEWMALHNDPDRAFLVVRSGTEKFPDDAITEIKQERFLPPEQVSDFPPCKVEIVLGDKGRLYVVLPTDVEAALPFACNAPFIQDPARLKIKNPEISPTNRWLLKRIGSLAASVMIQWLEQASLSLGDRSDAYDFLPDVKSWDSSLEGTCASMVDQAFNATIKDKAFLLTEAGELKPAGQSVVIPEELLDVWPVGQTSALLDCEGHHALSRNVSENNQKKLVHRGFVPRISKDKIFEVLQTAHLPRPGSWNGLLMLWNYVAPEITSYRSSLSNKRQIRIIPVQGKDVLYAASEIVRLGEKRLLQTDEDWDFLATHLLVLNQNWPRFLAEQRREAEEHQDKNLQNEIAAAYAILKAFGLEETSDVSTVVEQVALDFFKKESIQVSECIQFAQIACKLNATVEKSFRFVTQDRHLRSVEHVVLFNADRTLETLFPENWCLAHLLHPDYSKSFKSCNSEEWIRWISSGRAGLHLFAPLVKKQTDAWGHQNIISEIRKRGFEGGIYPQYKTSVYLIKDWDFEETHWDHWVSLSFEDKDFWGNLVERILAQPEKYWSKAKSAEVLQVATTGNTKAIIYDPLLPTWILKLRDRPCLQDTRGFYRIPSVLLRRTQETESIMDVEPFIHGRLDTEAARPLLIMLGVRDKPTGPDRLIDFLRALAKAEKPPVHEVEKWYQRLDQMVDTCSTADFEKIKSAFWNEKIILTNDPGWTKASGVFLSSDENDAPGAAVVRDSVSDLSLWRKINIAERPTADLAIQWLKDLPTGKTLPQDDAKRVRSLLSRHPVRIWNECGHWLNLAGEWVPTENIYYSLSMQTLTRWGHLHLGVKQKTADFQNMQAEVITEWPFSGLVPLASKIENRAQQSSLFQGAPKRKPWLNQIGLEFCRIKLEDEKEETRIRDLATQLADTVWQPAAELEVVPYIDGTPAGTSSRIDVVWLNKILFYDDGLSKARIASFVPDRLGKIFGRSDIMAALNYCFGRSSDEITEYLEENFNLMPRDAGVDQAVEGFHDVEETPKSQNGESLASLDTESTVGQDKKELDKDEAGMPIEDSQHETELQGSTGELDSHGAAIPKNRSHPSQVKPSIMERFAKGMKFQKDGETRFFCSDGSWIAKTKDEPFPWERRTASGELVCYYWPKNHCLEREPLQIGADIWGLIDRFPQIYSLILLNPQDDPFEISGELLRAMRNDNKLILYPATYRLVYKSEDES